MAQVKYIAAQRTKFGATIYTPGMEIPEAVAKKIPALDAFVGSHHIIRIEEGQPLSYTAQRLLADARRLGIRTEPQKVEKPAEVKAVKLPQTTDKFTAAELIGDQHEKTKAPVDEPTLADFTPSETDPLALARKAVGAKTSSTFDPNAKTVREVVEYIKANPNERDTIIAREKAGLNRAYAAKLAKD